MIEKNGVSDQLEWNLWVKAFRNHSQWTLGLDL